MLGNKRKKLASKLTMLYSARNSTAVQEELHQLDVIFKLVRGINDRIKAVDKEINNDDKWFEQLEEKVFSFKHTTHSWLKDVELERIVTHAPSREGSKKGSKASSLSSSRSLKTRPSSSDRSSIKDKAINERMKITELKTEHLFMEKKKAAEYEAESIRIQEQVAKAEARAKVLEDLDGNCKGKAEMNLRNPVAELEDPQHKVAISSWHPKMKELNLGQEKSDTNVEHRIQQIYNEIPVDNASRQRIPADFRRTNLNTAEPSMIGMPCKLLRQQAAPEVVDVKVFHGNLLSFEYFISVFKEAVETNLG